jgi:hypothetical protein
MAKKNAQPSSNGPLPLADGISAIRAVRVVASPERLKAFAASLPKTLNKVVLDSFDLTMSFLIGTSSPGVLKLKRVDLKELFTHCFPEYPHAAMAAFDLGPSTPIIDIDTYPHRAPNNLKRNLPRNVQWWENMLNARLEFPAEYFGIEMLAKWAPYMDLGVETAIQDAIGRLFAAVIDAGGPDGDRLKTILVSSLGKSPQVLLGGQVIFALWGSRDPSLNELIHKALFEKRFATQRRHILAGAVKTSAERLLPLLNDIFQSDLLADAEFGPVVEEVLGLSDVFPAISAKKADRDKALEYLAKRARGDSQRPIAWLDSYWKAWSASIHDIDEAIPILSRLVHSDDVKTRLAAMALAKKIHVVELLQKVKPKSDEKSLATIYNTLDLMARADKKKRPEAKRKERIAEVIAIYKRAVDNPKELKKLGKEKSSWLFTRIEQQFHQHWKDESFSIIAPLLKERELLFDFIVPDNYKIPDDETVQILLDRINIEIEWEEGYLDNLHASSRSMNALLRSDLSFDSWIRFLKHVHVPYYALPTKLTERLNALPEKTLTDIISTLFADKTPKHRIGALGIAVACRSGKHKKLIAKLRPKLVKSMPKPKNAVEKLLNDAEEQLLKQLDEPVSRKK